MPESLKSRDFQVLQRCITELYELGSLEHFKSRVLRVLPTAVPGDITLYAEVDPRTRAMRWDSEPATNLGLKDAASAFAAHMRDFPLFESYQRGQGSAVKISDVRTRRQFQRTALYNEFYRRVGVEHHIVKGLPGPPGIVTALGILRRHSDFTERDRLVLNLLRPHLNRAYENAAAASRMQAQVDLLRRGFESLDHGVIVVARDGGVATMSAPAHRWCAQYFGRRTGDGLPDALRRWVRRHDADLARRERPMTTLEPLRVIQDGRELTVRIVLDGEQRLLLLSERDRTARPERLESLGLSRREAEVLAWVAEGKTNGEIATILGGSTRTIDKHVEHIRGKLGVETRTAAASRALDLLRG